MNKKLVFLSISLVLLSGCAQIESFQKERAKYFAPEPLPDHKTIFTAAYTQALTDAHKNPTPQSIAAFVDAGNALNAQYCTNWFQKLTLARRGLVSSDHNLAVAGGLLTMLAGILDWSSKAVAILGASQAAIQAFGTNIQTDILGAPSQFQAQETVYALQRDCGDKLLKDAPSLSFSSAYGRLEGCSRICSFDAASDVATKALQQQVK